MDSPADEARTAQHGDPKTTMAGESSSERRQRHRQRRKLYAQAIAGAASLTVLIALIVDNTRHVKVSWVVGSSDISLIWLVLVVAAVAYFLGMITSILFRRRTRRRTS